MNAIPLSALIAAIGDANIGVQSLDQTITGARLRNGYTSITFGTQAVTPSQVLGDSDQLGLVIWLPRKRVQAVYDEYAQRSA